MNRAYYSNSIQNFLSSSSNEIIGILARNNEFSLDRNQQDAWLSQINILKDVLHAYSGSIYFEYSIPRMGKRIDVLVIIQSVIFILEFKVGEKEYHMHSIDQVWDYALDMKNFHETSHDKIIVPILIATHAKTADQLITSTVADDNLLAPIRSNVSALSGLLANALQFFNGDKIIDISSWEAGRYHPTPTIIEAALALYNNHTVADISRTDDNAINLKITSQKLSQIIEDTKERSEKAICFVTGVPGAGKTLVGLDIATQHFKKESELYSVFLSGNGPLVKILQEALARDQVQQAREKGEKLKIGQARSEVKAFIQNVHHFRDDGLKDNRPPVEHVALFDEAQRAWTLEQTTKFMQQRKNIPDFEFSEPEFLVSCLDRHQDWAVVVCLVGGGQEINTGEAGISEWINSLERSFPEWKIYISDRLTDNEYNASEVLTKVNKRNNVEYLRELHLAVSMRSFRAENLSLWVKQLLDLDTVESKQTLQQLQSKYPIVITRDLNKAKKWLQKKARGSERYGIVVSSQAQRLKPFAIDVKSPVDPIHWFLDEKDDIRSSYYLEDVATEFHVQGLELDWVCVTWDADFRYTPKGWEYWSFKGNKWYHVRKEERQNYLKNAYRVLLTRARQGMVIVVPQGDKEDATRTPEFYNSTFDYLKEIGIEEIK